MENNRKRGDNLLEDPTLIQKGIFSTHEAEKILGWPRKALNPILFRLVRKGKLIRIKRGLFCIWPPGTKDSQKGYPCNWHLIAKALVAQGSPYFFSHYSAMKFHGMTSESIQTIFVSVPRQHQTPQALRIPLRFVTLPQEKFWGLEEKWVTHEEKVSVSDLERTILDALDRLDLAGGITEAARGFWLVKKEINLPKLFLEAERFGSGAVTKRLGFLVETLEIASAKELEALRPLALSRKGYVLLDPTLKKAGRYLHRWRLILNKDPNEIKKNLMT